MRCGHWTLVALQGFGLFLLLSLSVNIHAKVNKRHKYIFFSQVVNLFDIRCTKGKLNQHKMRYLLLYLLIISSQIAFAQSYDLPFTEDFEDAPPSGIPEDWYRFDSGNDGLSGAATNADFVLLGRTSYALYNALNERGDYVLISPEITDMQNEGVQVIFYARGTIGSKFEIGTMTDPTDLATFTVLENRQFCSDNIEQFQFKFPANGDKHVAIRHKLIDVEEYLIFDNFKFRTYQDCYIPEDVYVSSLTNNSATISWSKEFEAVNGFDYLISDNNTLPTNQTVPSGSLPPIDSFVRFDNLAPNSTYYVFVRSRCANGTSEWSSPQVFTTQCAINITFYQGFEGTTSGAPGDPNVPGCWNYLNTTPDDDNFGTYVLSYPNNQDAQTGDACYVIKGRSTSGNNYMLISPAIPQLLTDGINLKFGVKGSGNQQIQIGSMGNPNDANTFKLLMKYNFDPSAYDYENIELDISARDDAYIAIKYIAGGISRRDYYDNFTFGEINSCTSPTNVMASNSSYSATTLTWDAPNEIPAEGYEYTLIKDGAFPPDHNTQPYGNVDNSTLSVRVRGLQSSTNYSVYVRSVCSPINKGEWSLADNFNTVNAGPTINIPDCKFEQALLDLGIDSDSALNGIMLLSEAVATTKLDLFKKNISDMTGIEYFVNLDTLILTRNKLESINVSQNTKLKNLSLGFNNLTSIDISNNTQLLSFRAGDNELTNIDVSSNTALEKLSLSDNLLTVLNVSTLSELDLLTCSYNNLNILNVSQNSKLTKLQCSNNPISFLNVKNGNNVNFERLWADDNPNLTCIQVDDANYSESNWNTSDFDFDAQVSFSENCSNVSINIPDANFEQALIDLGIDSDGIINGFMQESDALGIENLDVNSKNISDLTGIELFTDLETLSAFNNNLASIDLSQNTKLSGITLGENNLTNIDLSNNLQLVSLNAASNALTNLDLSNNSALKQVYISDNNITAIDVSVLANLEELDISKNELLQLDVNQNNALNMLLCADNFLVNLSMQNGNNSAIASNRFDSRNNSNLTCIEVDDVTFSNTNWTQIDAQTTFATECSPTNDDCVDAAEVVLAQEITGSTASSSPSGNNPNCQQSGVVIFDVWYQFVAPSSGSIVVTLSSGITIKGAIYEDCTANNPILCAENELTADNLVPGQTYFIQIWIDALPGGRLPAQSTVGDFTMIIEKVEVTSSTLDEEQLSFNLYPNPARETAHINANQTIRSYQIFNYAGKAVQTNSQLDKQSFSINISSLPKGMYSIRLEGDGGWVFKTLIVL